MSKPVSVSSKGQVSIPADVRRNARLRAGDRLDVRWENGRIVMEKAGPAHSLAHLAEGVRRRYGGRHLEREILLERARDRRHEKARRP